MMRIKPCERCGKDYMYDVYNQSEYKDRCQDCKIIKGDTVTTTEQTKVMFGYPDGMKGTVVDVINEPYKLVVNFPEMGEDYREFFNEDELIEI